MISRLVPIALLALAAPLAAQQVARQQGALPNGPASPRITPDGDPSVKSDTIYSLRVNPADHPEDDVAYLLDDGVVRVEQDGRRSETFRVVVQILRPEAVETWQERRFSYAPKHERMTINWIRVIGPDGKVISDGPSHVQDSDVPAQMGDPVYSDRKVRRLSLTGVAEGTIIDYSYTTEELKPFLPGDFYQYWGINLRIPVQRSRLILDVPGNMAVRVREKNLNFRRGEHRAGNRIIHTWATGNLPKVKTEKFAADSSDVFMSVIASSPMTWEQLGAWYAGHAKGRYTLGAESKAKMASVVAGATTRRDSLLAVHKWVVQDVRYVSIALGLGGYQPRTPDEVVRTGYGDCKDKATLYIAALAEMGITAYPVLLNSTGGVDRGHPSLEQLDHAIAAVKTDSGYDFVDLTASLTPLGELPYGVQGEFGLVVLSESASEVVTMPLDPVTANRTTTRIVGTLSPEGRFNGTFEETGSGSQQYSLRNAFENPLDSTTRAEAADNLAEKFFAEAEGDSLVYTPGKDLLTPPSMRSLIINGRATTSAGSRTEILENPFGTMAGAGNIARDILKEPRRFPINAASILGAQVAEYEMRVTLPEGWRASLPPAVSVTGEFGTYRAEYSQEGRELRLYRRMEGARGVIPAGRIGELADWLRAVAKDDAKMIVLEKGTAGE
jgi:hypothetical protein